MQDYLKPIEAQALKITIIQTLDVTYKNGTHIESVCNRVVGINTHFMTCKPMRESSASHTVDQRSA